MAPIELHSKSSLPLSAAKRLTSSVDLNPEFWANETGVLIDQRVGQMTYVNAMQAIDKARRDRFFMMPCNLDWSSANSRRFFVSTTSPKCLRFIASSFGDIFLVLATNPNDEYTWYMIQISSYGVAFYRVIRES